MKTPLAVAIVLFASSASAADAERLEPHEKEGYFDKSGRVGLYYFQGLGTRPADVGFGAAGDFKRSGFGVDFDYYGYWDETRFGTLIGAEFKTSLGLHRAEVLKDPAPGNESVDANRLFLRMDAAFDYGLVHWDAPIKGRIAGGAGLGFDIDGGRSYAATRSYAILLARAQLWPNDSFSLNGAYYYVPTTGSSNVVIREHRLEGSLGFSSLQVGLRIELTRAKVDPAPGAPDTETYTARQASAFVAYAF
jgi:opacity protein-like surface antigen